MLGNGIFKRRRDIDLKKKKEFYTQLNCQLWWQSVVSTHEGIKKLGYPLCFKRFNTKIKNEGDLGSKQ